MTDSASLSSEHHQRAKLTDAEVIEIRARYAAGETMQAIARDYPRVGWTAVQKIVRRTTRADVGGPEPAQPPERAWTDAENTYLHEHADEPIPAQATALGRSHAAVLVQRSRLGIADRASWTDAEDRYLREHKDQAAKDIAQYLGRTRDAISARRRQLGIARRRTSWTDAEDRYLREHAGEPAATIAVQLGHSMRAISERRRRLGIAARR